MKTFYLESVNSTQLYLKNRLQKDEVELPCAVYAGIQTDGVGSRDNKWEGIKGNLFLSIALPLDMLPSDLKIESASIYFSYLLKEVLEEKGSKVWLKWPNDFYMEDKKIGGMITNVISNVVLCGVGVNLVKSAEEFGVLDIRISKDILVENFLKKIEKRISWKEIFSKYKLEFDKSKSYFTHKKDVKISMQRAILESDGSIIVDDERVYSLR